MCIVSDFYTSIPNEIKKNTRNKPGNTNIWGCVTRNNWIGAQNWAAILQHSSVEGNFVYFDAASCEFSSNDMVTFELAEIAMNHFF